MKNFFQILYFLLHNCKETLSNFGTLSIILNSVAIFIIYLLVITFIFFFSMPYILKIYFNITISYLFFINLYLEIKFILCVPKYS